jgi:hypothetical protein
MCTGRVTSDERVVKANSSGSRMRRKTWSGLAHPSQYHTEDPDLDDEADIHQPDQLREAEHRSETLGCEQVGHDRQDRQRRQRDDPPGQAEHRRHDRLEQTDDRLSLLADAGQRDPEQDREHECWQQLAGGHHGDDVRRDQVEEEFDPVDRHCEIGWNLAGRNQPDAEPGMKQAVKPERDQDRAEGGKIEPGEADPRYPPELAKIGAHLVGAERRSAG